MKQQQKITIILGPTASGKSKLALTMAKKTGAEIISADAYQVYRYMNIGTAKVSEATRATIPHHLIDIKDPDDTFSVSDFQIQCSQLIDTLTARQTPIILCGGTGLYISSILFNYEFQNHDNSADIRLSLEKQLETKGLPSLVEDLLSIDPVANQFVDIQNYRRVIRAIERYHKTNLKPSELSPQQQQRDDVTLIGLQVDRPLLINRINLRVDTMIKEGLIDEVSDLLKKGYSPDLPSLKALGYKEPIQYLHGIITKEEMIEQIKIKTRQFAKRQMTWFRRFENVNWTAPS
jgi:tRNA dimethylallyltransferase